MQMSLEAHARHSDPETSHDAAESVTRIRESQRCILAVLHARGPMTDEQLVETYLHSRLPRQSPSGIRTRRSELTRRGLVFDTGSRERLQSGRKAIVWMARTDEL